MIRNLLALVLLLVFWSQPISAQDFSHCASVQGALCPDQGAAAQAAGAAAQAEADYSKQQCINLGHSNCDRYSVGSVTTTDMGYPYVNQKAVTVYVIDGGTPSNSHWRRFPGDATCSTREPQLGGWAAPGGADVPDVCHDGCYYGGTLEIPVGGEGYEGPAWYPSGAACVPNEDAPPPEPDADGDGVPDDQDAFPNDPNEQTDADEDGVGDNADTAPEDPDNGADDGEGNESDNVAAGGGTCQAPPTCSGDGIACAQLYQQWRTRCAVEGERQGVTGTACGEIELKCTGMGVQQCYDLYYAKKAACALEGMAGEGGDEEGDDDENNNGQPDWTEVDGLADDGSGDDPDSPNRGIIPIGTDRLDEGGLFGGSRACPQLGTLNLGRFGTFNLDALPWWCDFIAVVRGVVLLLAAFAALRILMGGD